MVTYRSEERHIPSRRQPDKLPTQQRNSILSPNRARDDLNDLTEGRNVLNGVRREQEQRPAVLLRVSIHTLQRGQCDNAQNNAH